MINSEDRSLRSGWDYWGRDDRVLKEKGFTIGHEPDSVELSTVGGWVTPIRAE